MRAQEEIDALRKIDWEIRNDFETELPLAKQAHESLQHSISEMMGDLQDGRSLDLQKLQDGVDAMIESITRNPTAFTWLKELKRKDNYAYQHGKLSAAFRPRRRRRCRGPRERRNLERVAGPALRDLLRRAPAEWRGIRGNEGCRRAPLRSAHERKRDDGPRARARGDLHVVRGGGRGAWRAR